jgi:DNA primase small subunit
MAKTVALTGSTLAWARGQFARYYAATPVPPPPRLDRREFAAFPFTTDSSMRRHTTLRTEPEFHEFLVREVPRHVYYSTAYYRLPAEPTMARKEWLGADLLFDLDADHLRGAESLDYAAQLRLVKSRLLDLVDDFLLGDFAIPPEELAFVFSGGRGYHVHVRDARFLSLTSPERRELVDYIQGTGFDARRVVSPRHLKVGGEEDGGRARGATVRLQELPSPEAPGWRGRTGRAVLALLDRWEAGGSAEPDLVAWGIPKAHAHRMARILFGPTGGAARIRSSRPLDALPGGLQEEFLEAVVPRAAVEVQGETDAPVTTDIHRLIRLPGSLHGGTGFRVTPLSRAELESFDPLRDAVLPSTEPGRVAVVFQDGVHYALAGHPVEGAEGERAELPSSAALFLCLRGEAVLPP